MSRFRIVGMDWFDVVVHVGVTIMACVAADALFPGRDEDVAIAVVLAASLVLLGLRRRKALAELPDSPVGHARIEELEARLAELDQVHDRLVELEDRLDFTERMLGQQREQERLPRV
ncbi:MAG TPA: hypothetical protein VJN95_11750 [Gemmatimonadales bacterium]|nr:hypothetical protein [Gemmatimonadales bacterium]